MNITRFPTALNANRALSRLNPAQMGSKPAANHRIGFRDFNHLRTQTTPTMSDEEIKEAVRAQAREDAARGVFDWHGENFTNLRESFISSVSPNRHSIVASHPAMIANMMFGGAQPQMLLLNFGGEIVGGFDAGRGWSASITRAEAARQQMISDVYHDAWVAARYGTDGNRSSDNAVINGSGVFDAHA